VQAQCDANAVPCGPVNRAPDLLADAHVAAREAIVSAHDPEIGEIKMQAVFPKLSETPGGVRWPAKRLGADNDYVWREIAGVGEDRMAALKAAGVI
jgi:crotonobetainyl-CoA:carnitine CoA-transferase CaiB-like acyl-CoA transferase